MRLILEFESGPVIEPAALTKLEALALAHGLRLVDSQQLATPSNDADDDSRAWNRYRDLRKVAHR